MYLQHHRAERNHNLVGCCEPVIQDDGCETTWNAKWHSTI